MASQQRLSLPFLLARRIGRVALAVLKVSFMLLLVVIPVPLTLFAKPGKHDGRALPTATLKKE